MVKSSLSPWMPPVTTPCSGPLMPPVAVAFPEAVGPIELKTTVSPLDCLPEKFPLKRSCLQPPGARGSTGPASAGAGIVRNPIAVIAVAAASNWGLVTTVNCDIGNPFHLTPAIRKEAICSVGGERIDPPTSDVRDQPRGRPRVIDYSNFVDRPEGSSPSDHHC